LKNKASRTIEESADKMEREKTKVDEYEASLAQEEKILETIQDSLKGEPASNEMHRLLISVHVR
jgi:hypothetical protein